MPQTLTPTGAPSIFGGVGRLEWSAGSPDDPFPVWQDITTFVRTENNPLKITRGRQNELDQVRPSQLTCDLDNTDNRFTFGYLAGPYGSTWTPAKQIRYSETIGLRTFVLYKGWIEYPDIADWQPIGLQYVQLTCTDRLTRLSRGRPFVSTLAEYIVFNGGTDLKGYWPMTDAAEPFAGYGPWATALDMRRGKSGTTGLSVAPQPNTGLAPSGGEFSGARCVTAGAGTSGHAFVQTFTPADFAPAVGASDAIVVVFWWAFPPSMAQNDSLYRQICSFNGPTAAMALEMSSGSRQWVLTVSGLTGSISGGFVGDQALLPVGLYLKESTGVAELWTGSVRQTTTLTGAPVGAGTFAWGGIGLQCDYDASHLQIYIGNGFTYANYLRLIDVGSNGLAGQTTGQRIGTLLDFAGIATGDRLVDPGQSIMQQAQIAGQDPGTAIAAAVNTERGRGFAAGYGPYTFHDRVRTLNV